MKFRSIHLFGLLLLLLAAVGCQAPKPKGEAGFLTRHTAVVCTDEQFESMVCYLAEFLPIDTLRVCRSVGDASWAVNHLRLTLDSTLTAEAFRLSVTPDGVDIYGADYGGVFNGVQEFLRQLPPDIYARRRPDRIALRDTVVTDAPRMTYRGMMLDVARTWMTTAQVKRLIDLLAWHRINKLHFHLTDDEGWRIEIRSHPELAEVGGFRGGDSPVRAVYGSWHTRYGGYYTQEEMRELVRYAAARNIEIIPEIDLPGHSRAIGTLHPEIRCPYPPDTLATAGYDTRSAWCVAREENYALLEDILAEVCALFPSPYIHIGGDEVRMEQWESCPACQALMHREQMTRTEQLEDYFLERLTRILAAHGKRPGVWCEAVATGEFTRESRVYGWKSVEACRRSAAQGYPTIVMPGQYFYFDMRQSPREDGHNWAAIFDARKVLDFDLRQQGFTDEELAHVVGVEATFFSEISLSHQPEQPDYVDYMLFPRVCALSAVAWVSADRGWEEFYRDLVATHYDRMTAMGIRFRLFPPQISDDGQRLSVTTDDGSSIYYLCDGDPQEHLYTEPMELEQAAVCRFFTRRGTGRSPYVAHPCYYCTLQPAVTITSSIEESASNPFALAAKYKEAGYTRRTCRVGDWIRYDFQEPLCCGEITLATGYAHLPRALVPSGYVEMSTDGVQFQRVGDLTEGTFRFQPAEAVKALRICSTANGNGESKVIIQPLHIRPQVKQP